MLFSRGEAVKQMQQNGAEGLIPEDVTNKISPGVEKISRKGGVDHDILQRAYDREEEERDLRVLDAYNRFEEGLVEILSAPDNGVMQRRAGEAQSAVLEVNDYFAEQGGKLRDELPDDESRARFMDILASRRRTAVNAVARYQSQEYQNWKDSTAGTTIDSVLRAVNISPDADSLIHGEKLIEGAILRLYRGSNPELLEMRLESAKQAMFTGALESIGMKDPVTGLIIAESWRERIGEQNYEAMVDKLDPLARNQNLKLEFNSLRNLEGDELESELADITDKDMKDELWEMVMADRIRQDAITAIKETERINLIFRGLFKGYMEDSLTMEQIIDSGLDDEQRMIWRQIFALKGSRGDERSLLDVVEAIVDGGISEEYQIYSAIPAGLSEMDTAMLSSLFTMKDNPEAKLIINGFDEIAEKCEEAGGNDGDHAAAIRDFLNRLLARIQKGEIFSVTELRNEVIDDHFKRSLRSKLAEDEPEQSTKSEYNECESEGPVPDAESQQGETVSHGADWELP